MNVVILIAGIVILTAIYVVHVVKEVRTYGWNDKYGLTKTNVISVTAIWFSLLAIWMNIWIKWI